MKIRKAETTTIELTHNDIEEILKMYAKKIIEVKKGYTVNVNFVLHEPKNGEMACALIKIIKNYESIDIERSYCSAL